MKRIDLIQISLKTINKDNLVKNIILNRLNIGLLVVRNKWFAVDLLRGYCQGHEINKVYFT